MTASTWRPPSGGPDPTVTMLPNDAATETLSEEQAAVRVAKALRTASVAGTPSVARAAGVTGPPSVARAASEGGWVERAATTSPLTAKVVSR